MWLPRISGCTEYNVSTRELYIIAQRYNIEYNHIANYSKKMLSDMALLNQIL